MWEPGEEVAGRGRLQLANKVPLGELKTGGSSRRA